MPPSTSTKVAIYVSETALAPIEAARETITRELGLGEAPPLDLMLELALLRVDSEELATSVQATLLGRRIAATAELPFGEPPLDAER